MIWHAKWAKDKENIPNLSVSADPCLAPGLYCISKAEYGVAVCMGGGVGEENADDADDRFEEKADDEYGGSRRWNDSLRPNPMGLGAIAWNVGLGFCRRSFSARCCLAFCSSCFNLISLNWSRSVYVH